MAYDDKAKLYKTLVASTNEHTVLERMRVNGFWPRYQDLPRDPPQEVAERAEIEAELTKLRAQATAVHDPEKALAEERQRRWEASKKRRKESKAKRAAEAKQRRETYAAFRATHVVHLGLGVSAGLEGAQSDVAKLSTRGLPVLHDSTDVAKALGVSLPMLRWLTYHRRSAAMVHYRRYDIPKKTGGVRHISAPKPRLAAAQRWVFEKVLGKLETAPSAHGFVKYRSLVTGATPHVGKAVVLNLDLKDFFPSITWRRVKGLFVLWGYSEHVATVLALLCTEPPRVAATLDGKMYHVALGERVLPQGACTSPAITNLLCRRLDARLAGLARRFGYVYTRYADDLSFASDTGRDVNVLRWAVRKVLVAEGFTDNPSKTRVMRASQRQEVTGLVVNKKLTVTREYYKNLRATLFNCAKHGLASQNRDGHGDFAAHLRGKVEFVASVDPVRGAALREALTVALAKP